MAAAAAAAAGQQHGEAGGGGTQQRGGAQSSGGGAGDFGDKDSLNCNLSVNYRELRGQCSVNRNPLLRFGDGKQEGNVTELCPYLFQSLKDTLGVMWSLQSGNDALQVTTNCQYTQEKLIDGYVEIIKFNEKYRFYPLNKTWKEGHSEASGAMEQWKNDKELEQGLSKVLTGDFSDCLNKLLPHSREIPTLPTTPAHMDQLSSMACSSKPSVQQIMFICLLLSLLLHSANVF
ncbi:histocompatibility antigen 60c-like [Apodemus sylvaticus]|uniref:histocompatibility antigen 60c-like n=1 Tax=Apodemus sylvaticus TaxID=10129 RepID=UPI002244AF82|nr:histocompatibility antigen 60c-like [Apodemus sylvaticus]